VKSRYLFLPRGSSFGGAIGTARKGTGAGGGAVDGGGSFGEWESICFPHVTMKVVI